jgi:hypothetical protein
MPDPVESFLVAATRSFGDNAELQIIARRELEAMLDPAAEHAAEDAAKRFDAVDAQSHPLWKRYLPGIVAALSLLLAGWTAWGIYRDWDELQWLDDGGGSDEVVVDWIRTLPPADQLILLGDPDALTLDGDMKKLWESDPENPAYFAEYTRATLKNSKKLPPRFTEIATGIDPDNGYFLLLQGYDPGYPGFVDSKKPATRRKPGDPPQVTEWQINDPVKWQESLDLIRRAAAMPVYKSYAEDLARQRVGLFPPPTDLMSLAPRFQYLFSMRNGAPDPRFASIVAAKAEDCLKQNDREGLLQLRRDWDRLVTASLADVQSTIMAMVMHRSLAGIPLENFIASAEGLGLTDEAAMLRARREPLSRDNSPLFRTFRDDAMRQHLANHGGYLKGSSYSNRLPSVEELKPGRLAEYEWFGRFGALAAWLVLALASVLVWSYRFRTAGTARQIARRLMELLPESDRFLIAAVGVGLPMLLAYAGTYLTPLGARDWSISVHGGTVPLGQLIALLLLVILLPLSLARVMLRKRAGWLGLKAGACYGGWIAVAACIAAWVLFGVAQLVAGPDGLLRDSGSSGIGAADFFELDPERAEGSGAIWLWTAEGLLAFSLLYLLIAAARSLFSKHRHLLRRALLGRLILPAYLLGMLAFAILMPLHHAAERHWVARDELLRLAPANHGLPALEAELARLDRAQLLKALGTPP